MRSRLAGMGTRGTTVVLGLASAMLTTTVLTAGVGHAEGTTQVVAQSGTLDSLSTPVGLTAVGLGVIGMIAGVLRRKKAEVQPQDQRKS